ncbi:MAG: hypothetical protein LCH84_09035 [Gemmatimonadetes bacterium]|nr:hypothetical protein [Gemmatimonadota bacterium]
MTYSTMMRHPTGRAPGRRLTQRAHAAAVGALLLLAAATRSASAQQADAAPFDAITDVDARGAIRTMIADAAARGLPTAPLVTKVREGVAKRAAPDRIRVATATLVDRLTAAAAALAPTRAADELTAGADALQAGVSTATLRDLRKLWPNRSLTVPLGVLAEMVANGVSHANATRRVRELLARGATTTQVAAMGTSVQADIAAGLAPDAAMELRSKGVLSVIQANEAFTAGIGIAAPTRVRPPVKK